MSYVLRGGLCNEMAMESDTIAECPGVVAGVVVGLGEWLGEGGGLAFCGGLTTAGGGVVISTFSFSEGSLVRSGKRGIFGSLRVKIAAPVMSLPFTRRSRLPELAT